MIGRRGGQREKLGVRLGEAESLEHLGDAHQAAGADEEARAAWRAALAILDDLADRHAAAVRAKLAQDSGA